MDFLITCLCLLGYCFLLRAKFKLQIEATPFLVISSIIPTLYIFALANLLLLGNTLILGMGALSLIYTSFLLWKDRSNIFKEYLTPGLIIGLLICILAIIFAHRYIMGWDEYGFWGPFVKFMKFHNGLIRKEDMVSHKIYPPGASLFYYLFIWRGYNESKLLMAHQLFLLLPLLALLPKISWKNWFTIIAYFFIGYMLVDIFYNDLLHIPIMHFWDSLYQDIPVSIFFGTTLTYYYLSHKKNADILRLAPAVFTLLLLKASLFPIFLFIITFISIDQVIYAIAKIKQKKMLSKDHTVDLFKKYLHPICKRLISIFILFFSGILAHYSWRFYANSVNAAQVLPIHNFFFSAYSVFFLHHISTLR